ncbi:hypothetical protein J3E69DRAFT_374757 [Trichoderma sp. SZMC 28015]
MKPDMASSDPESTRLIISNCATRCIQSLQQCRTKAAYIHDREMFMVEIQLGEFSLWTAFNGVFASGRESLDYRLQGSPDLQDAIIVVMEALDYSILNCTSILETSSPVGLARPLPAINAKFSSALQDITNQIALLRKFSLIILRMGRETQDPQAIADFKVTDDNGHDLEPTLKDDFAQYIRFQFPGVSNVIQQRLINTMILRYKKALYRKFRCGKVLERSGSPSNSVDIAQLLGRNEASRPENDNSDPEAMRKLKEILEKGWDEVLEAAEKIDCPFCCLNSSAGDVVDESKWNELHVEDDLDSYVCLFEGCESPEEVYSHKGAWLEHMSSHYMRWRCVSKSHAEFQSTTKREYIDHMKIVHPNKFTDAQLSVLAIRIARPSISMFQPCPLCGIEEIDGNRADYVARHLLHLALVSLPIYEEHLEEQKEVEC